jgi:hypothetical protein
MNTQITNFVTRMTRLRTQISSVITRPIFSHPSLAFFKRLLNDTVYKNYISNATTCWKHLGAQRNAALCSICAGNSAAFFNKIDYRAWVDLPTCAATLKECSVYLSETSRIVGGVQKLLTIFNATDPAIVTSLTWVPHFNWLIGFAKLMQYLSKFELPLSTTDRVNAEVHLCNRIMLIRRVPVIYHINDKLNSINTGFLSLIDNLAKISGSRLLRLQSVKSSFSRSLQEIGFALDGLLASPTVTFSSGDIDLLAQSAGGLQSVSGDIPMNLTQRLP